MKTALIITTYDRPELLKQCLDSVLKCYEYEFDNGRELDLSISVIDDGSKDPETLSILNSFPFAAAIKGENKGIKHSLIWGFESAFENGEDLAINLDGDAIVKPDFITRLKDLKTRFPDRIISGFNCNHPKNPVLFDGGDYVERKHANGINFAISKDQYERIVRPALLKRTGNWDFDSSYDKNFIITKPSICDHLGWNNSTMNHGANGTGDRACDF